MTVAAQPQLIDISLWVGARQYHVEIVGGTAAMADNARARLTELSQLWLEDRQRGDLARLASSDTASVSVEPETLLLLALVQGVQPDPVARDDDVGRAALPAHLLSTSSAGSDRGGFRLDFAESRVELTRPIGQVLAASARSLAPALSADIVAAELIDGSAWGARLRVGRVVRAFGIDTNGDPWATEALTPTGVRISVNVADGGVATAKHSAAARDVRSDEPANPADVVWAVATAATASQAQLIADGMIGTRGQRARDASVCDEARRLTVVRRDGRLVDLAVAAV